MPSSISALINFNDTLDSLISVMPELENEGAVSSSNQGVNYLVVLGGCGSTLAPLLFMYYLTLDKRKTIITCLLFFIAMSSVLNDTAAGARGPLVKFSITMVLLYYFLKPFYSKKVKKMFVFVFAVVLGGGLLVFYLLTLVKFGYRGDDYISQSFLGYFSQNFLYFDSYGLDAGGIRYGTRTSTIITKLLFPNLPSNYDDRIMVFKNMKLNEGHFSTYVGDFTLDYGPILTLIIFVFFNRVISSRLKIHGKLYFHHFVLIFFIVNMMVGGLFLHPYCNLGGNLQVIVFIITYILAKQFGNVSRIRKKRIAMDTALTTTNQ